MSSFVNKGIRERFRLAVENEAHTCEACHTVWRYSEATKWQPTDGGTAKTVNFVNPDDDELDLGWAMGRRDRERQTIVVQCWGCGGVMEIPDTLPFIEYAFDHAISNCSAHLAERNRKRGKMPSYHH